MGWRQWNLPGGNEMRLLSAFFRSPPDAVYSRPLRGLRRWRCGWLALAGWVTFGVLQPAAAVTLGEIAIRSQGGVPVDADYVLTRTRQRAGMELDRHALARDVRALLDTGRFAYVASELQPLSADRARLVYVLEPKLKLVAPVEILGKRSYRDARLRDWAGLKAGDYVSEADTAVAAGQVRDQLRQRRYHQAEVVAQLLPDATDPSLATLRLTVTQGPRTYLQRVAFSGNTVFRDAELRRTMNLPRPWNPINWFRKQRYQPELLETAGDRVRDRYRNAGYLDVRVGAVESRVTSAGHRRVTLPIEEGPRYSLGDLRIEGAEVFKADELRSRLDLSAGETAAMHRIDQAGMQIRDFYAVHGYKNTGVISDLIRRPDEPVVDVRWRLREGQLTDIRQVHIRGNAKTRDKVIRRELSVAPGDRYDEVRIRRSENRLRNLGFFSYVGSYAEDLTPGLSDVVFQVEEQQTGQFMIGVGFSSIDKIIGFVELSQGNFDLFNWPRFTGGGQKLNLRAQFGSESKDYQVTLVEPWFLDRRLSLSLEGYVQQRSYRDYEVERIGGAVGLGIPLRGPHRLDIGYRLERIDLLRVADTNTYVGADGEPFNYATEGRRDKSTASLSVTRDTRDSFLLPTRGHRIRLGGTYSGGVLGFDADLYGVEARAAVYVPLWFDHVFSLQGRIEVVDAHGRDDDVALSDRLFAGGPRSVRGFRHRDVGPKASRVADDGSVLYRPQGGRSMAVAGAEYTIPLVNGIRLAAFADAGNVWMDAFDIHPDDVAVGAGMGLRFDLPGFPIRLDYAWPIRRDEPHTRTERFSFWIGHGF